MIHQAANAPLGDMQKQKPCVVFVDIERLNIVPTRHNTPSPGLPKKICNSVCSYPWAPSVTDGQVGSADLALYDAVTLEAVFPNCLDRY